MDKTSMLSKLSVLQFAAYCCICHVEIEIKNKRLSKFCSSPLLRSTLIEKDWRVDICPIDRTHLQSGFFSSPCTDFVLVFLEMHSTSTQVRSIFSSPVPCFDWRTAIQMYENWTIDSNTRRKRNTVLSHNFQHPRRKSQVLTGSSVLELGPSWIRAESYNRNCRLFFPSNLVQDVLSRFSDLRFRLRFHYILYVVFFVSFVLSSESGGKNMYFVVRNNIVSTFRRTGFQTCKHSWSSEWSIICLSILVRLFFCVRFWCLPMDSNFKKRTATNRHLSFSQICPRDVASTWHQKTKGKLNLLGLR